MPFLSISENILVFVSGFGILQGILLAALLYFHPKSDRTVSTFLALYIWCVSILILMPLGQQLFTWQVIIFVEPFTLLFGPLLLLYVRSFKEVITWRKAWPHLILFVLYLILSRFVYTEVGAKYPVSHIVPKAVTQHPLSVIPVSIRMVQRLVYYFLSLRALNSYQRSIRQLFSETSRINLRWVRWLLHGYLVVTIVTIVFYLLIVNRPENFSLWVLCIGACVTLYIYLATAKGVLQPTIWQLQPGMDPEKVESDMKKAAELETTGSKKIVPDAKFEQLATRITHIMEQDKLYQEPELTLQHLATRLGHPSYQVSLAINEGMKKSFYDLVNSYRVEEAKKLLLDAKNRNFTILSVGLDAGFNSKTTFNTVFKKITGLTPTEYRDKQNA